MMIRLNARMVCAVYLHGVRCTVGSNAMPQPVDQPHGTRWLLASALRAPRAGWPWMNVASNTATQRKVAQCRGRVQSKGPGTRQALDPTAASVVPVTGIELVTFALRMRCSTN
jgi:hypothetical protein